MKRNRTERATDLGLGALVLIVVCVAITANVGGDVARVGPGAYAFAVLFGALMLLRRSRPVAVLIATAVALLAYYALGYPPIGLAVPVAAALYSAAELGRAYWAGATALALLIISTAVRIGQGDDLALVLGLEVPTAAALMTAVVALGDSVRSRRGWRAELDNQAAAAELEREREAARRVEQERLRIARDLHDLLAHTVSVISLHADVAKESLREDADTAERSLTAVRTACRDASRELRATLNALRAPHGDAEDTPGLDQLDRLTEPARSVGLDVRVRTSGAGTPAAISDVTAYRVVQESLSNVLRHAHADGVLIELDYGAETVLVRVTDDGQGAHPGESGSGWGLAGMRERLALLGGELSITTRPGEGFVVEARVPMQAPA